MAERPVFISCLKDARYVTSKDIKFEWFPGFSVKQKQKSINSFHNNIRAFYPSLKVLEISSKSNEELGVALSAFNLMIQTKIGLKFSVETAFQASKVFENGGPFLDLYEKTSVEAKKDHRIKESGELLHFQFSGKTWGLEPKTIFYDWLYVNALVLNKKLSEEILKYEAFTDIEFNPQKSINCQARSAALYVSLYKDGVLEKALSSPEKFEELAFAKNHDKNINTNSKDRAINEDKFEQLNIFNNTDV